ncbi:MAG: hypothetical protein AB7M12_02220 [Hyphomonadaceae bacterium]
MLHQLAEAPLLASTGRGAVSEYANHLEKIAAAFNDHAASLGLGVRLDPESAIDAACWAPSSLLLSAFGPGVIDGVVQRGQLRTALDCVANILADPTRPGLVLGPLQSGKSVMSMALQFAGPIIYLLTGRIFCPIQLVTRETRTTDSIRRDLARFMELFGDLRLVAEPGAPRHRLAAEFERAPSIASYRRYVLNGRLPDVFVGQDEFVRRARRGTPAFARVAQLCTQASALDWSPLLILDEPEFKTVEARATPRRPEFLEQVIEGVRAASPEDAPLAATFVGFTSTPYAERDPRCWVAKRYLSTPYIGFSAMSDALVQDGADVRPPRMLSFAQIAAAHDAPFFNHVDLSAYAAPAAAYARYARKRRRTLDQGVYRAQAEDALREVIHGLAEAPSQTPIGVCVRFFKNHKRSLELLARLELDPQKIEFVSWDDSGAPERSLHRAIEARRRRDLPFLILLSDEARMKGEFPRQIEWFLDFSKAPSVAELLQGPLGGACGCNRRAVAVLPDASIKLVCDYMAGEAASGARRQTSRHRPGAPTSLLRLHAEIDDPVVQAFFERLDHEVVEPQIGSHVGTFRIIGGHRRRMGPILRIAEEVGLFAHLETPEVRARLFPTMTEGMRIARAGDAAERPRAGEPLRYLLDSHGDCRFSFQRAWGGRGAHGPGRAGYGDQTVIERTRDRHHLEPQIHVLKVDPNTLEPINDAHLEGEAKRPGRWVATMVVLPLQRPVRELRLN